MFRCLSSDQDGIRTSCSPDATCLVDPANKQGGLVLHDVRAVGCGDQDIQVEDDVQVLSEVGMSIYSCQASAEKCKK